MCMCAQKIHTRSHTDTHTHMCGVPCLGTCSGCGGSCSEWKWIVCPYVYERAGELVPTSLGYSALCWVTSGV